jgi:predicted NAD-dependent protein-ADP-ribosyltransferase YbiA (DUF1768 family)
MELRAPEIARLKTILEEWSLHDDRELEATFKGASDTTTFLNVAQRLKSKGYEGISQEDRLNILTPEKLRFTLTGMGNITEYCKRDSLEGMGYEVMVKDRAGEESNLDIPEYGVRAKVRREVKLSETDPSVVEMFKRWPTQRKAFRYIKRWSFQGNGVRYDISMVRTSPLDAKGAYKWQTQFLQTDIMRQPVNYEIEVELERPVIEPTATEEEKKEILSKALKQFVAGIGEVLRGIQKHSILIRKSVANKALEDYKDLVKTDRFRGVAPVPLQKQNRTKTIDPKIPNIRTGYNVTDKADGLRMMGYVNGEGELFMIDMSLNVYRTGLIRKSCADSLVDGEYITQTKDKEAISEFWLFDIYIAPSKKVVSGLPFAGEKGRKAELEEWSSRWNEGNGPMIAAGSGVKESTRMLVAVKTFIVANAGDNTIFSACAKILDGEESKRYHTDGLILTPNATGLPERAGVGFKEQFKWKPESENTVDFLAIFDKDEQTEKDAILTGVRPDTGASVQYKTIHLYVGSELEPAYEDPRGTVLFEQPLPGARSSGPRRHEYKPVLFNPTEIPDTMANVCYVEVQPGTDSSECENEESIMDKSIIECRYEAGNAPGWRWIPIRIRHDKTERFQRGIIGRTMNKDEFAEEVWNSIHDPITYHMIRTGADAPSETEIEEMSGAVAGVAKGEVSKVYYERKAAADDIQLIRGLRDFHRLYIKENILLGSGLRGGGKILVDLACGQGGDLMSWVRNKARFVYGTDIAGAGIRDANSGAYRRYMNQVIKYGGYEEVPKMIFTIGSSAKNLASGEAGATPEESNIMRSIYGRLSPDGPVPPFVQKNGTGQLREGADCVAIMFAIHYFFESEESLTGFIQNVNDSLKMGGLFVGCCFDGRKVFDALRGIPENGSLVGKENDTEIWKLTKRYSNDDFTNTKDSVGMGIDVEFISIGTEQREYLVSFEYLKARMAEIGCDLLTPEECKSLGLLNSTNLFSESYEMAKKQGGKYEMNQAVKQYSFFNRWFIFKRRRGGPLQTEEEEEQQVEVQAAVQRNEGGKDLGKAEEREVEREVEPSKKKYELSQLYQFYAGAQMQDKLKIQEPGAARWLVPSAHFPIKDTEGVEYPSIEHYMAGMKYKLASDKPELGRQLFSSTGTIHQDYLRAREAITGHGAKSIPQEKEDELLKKEVADVKESSTKPKKYRATYDEGKWVAMKERTLVEAMTQRYERDEKLRKILTAAKNKAYYLLYYTASSGSEMGGHRQADKTIDGENKVGEIWMRLGGWAGK